MRMTLCSPAGRASIQATRNAMGMYMMGLQASRSVRVASVTRGNAAFVGPTIGANVNQPKPC